jgi:hypothetical protein
MFSLPGKGVYLEGMGKHIFFMDLMAYVRKCLYHLILHFQLSCSDMNVFNHLVSARAGISSVF